MQRGFTREVHQWCTIGKVSRLTSLSARLGSTTLASGMLTGNLLGWTVLSGILIGRLVMLLSPWTDGLLSLTPCVTAQMGKLQQWKTQEGVPANKSQWKWHRKRRKFTLSELLRLFWASHPLGEGQFCLAPSGELTPPRSLKRKMML